MSISTNNENENENANANANENENENYLTAHRAVFVNHTIPNTVLFPEVRRLLDEGREVTLTPQGVSMLPFIRGGEDSVVLRHTDSFQVGDILLVQIGDVFILHRLIRINEDVLTLRGDGNRSGIETCTKADVLGKVTDIISPKGRHKYMGPARLWQTLYPLRRYLLKAYRILYKIIRKL